MARLPILVVLALALGASMWVLSRPVPLALAGDNEALRHPLLTDAFRQLRAGTLPVWTSGRWGGSPLIGDPDLGALYAPYYLGYALTPFPHWRALDVSLCLHLGLLVAGVTWFLGVLGAQPLTAIAGAALFALNPTMAFIARTWGEYWAALAWWPWLLGAAAILARGPARGALLLATAALAAQVYAGYPQFALYSGTVALAWIVGGPGARRGGRLLIACLVAGGAVALAAPQILSGLAMARQSIRMGPAREAMMVALERVALRPLDWRDVFRPGALSLLLPCKVAPPTILLALVAVLQARFAPVFLGSVAGGAAILATGPNVLYRALHAVPPLSFFSGPLKLFYLFAFAAMTLAALGLDRVVRAPERSRRLALACLAPAAMLSVGDPLSATSMTLLAGGLVLAAVPARALSLALVAFVVASHVPFLAATHLITAPAFHYPTPFSVLLREPPPRPADGERYLALAGGREVYQVGMNFGALWGLESLNGVGALAQWRQLEVMERAAPGSVARLVRQVGASSVLVMAGGAMEIELARAGFLNGPAAPGIHQLRPPEPPLPRYQLVPRARAASAAEAIAAARAGMALDEGSVLVEVARLPGGAEGDPSGRLTMVTARPGLARLTVAVRRPTWLVAREPFYPGWCATVDGRPATVHPAGGFMLGILVDAGEHEVVLAYREPGLIAGGLLAIAAAVCLPILARRMT